ncbi:flavin reductase (DIM6/NTAB) family NADH-FMN oxidoreductase RutF [Methanomicrobium sp. W14]|uniref:flavin reductase family protein n=1 Tax=Methanomicrobium sp. W14 TaxID=2817839 RepID=UPI001AEB73D1|nr:flavin reductase family protein [Methanomicrobium sp. W14]MBP2133281.1 flavin reductase (DIM6/NTAB) family NADH-FMN oxidoreductase RutF [Methanomicrobium sp. W14]
MIELPLEEVYKLIEPGPVVLVTTENNGVNNVMTMSWHMAVEFVPPLIACIIVPGDYSFNALTKNGECVIAVPTVELAEKTVDIGNCSGEDTDKFKKFGLTPVAAEKVKAPLISECFANFECRVEDTTLVEKFGLFILEVVKAWTDPDHTEKRTFHARGDGTFEVDGKILNLKERMVKWPECM